MIQGGKKMRKIPMRRCVATFEVLEKKDLLRIVKTPEGEIKVDPSGKMNGRGAYLKKSLEALEIAKKKNSLGRALEQDIPNEIYEQIERMIIND